jgi:hypothetical protein
VEASWVEGEIVSEQGAPYHIQKAYLPQQIIGNMVFKVSTSILLYQPLMLLVLLLCGELVCLVEFDAWFDLPWFQGEYDILPLRNIVLWLLPS